MKRSTLRALFASAAMTAALALAGCNPSDVPSNGRAMAPLSPRMVSTLQEKRMEKESPLLVRIFKEESELEVWKQNKDGEFALLKTYPICKWSGDLGPKKKEGDRQAPEGFYTITPGQMNPNSSYYLAFNTGFPNTYDRAWGYTGSELMVHGDCSSRGCYAMTDEQIQEIYALARESFFGGQKAFQLQAFPFRMTAMNMARHRNNPNFAFWKMLKEGYDNFEASKQETKVAVCERRYVFDPVATDGATKPLSFNAKAACPAYQLDKNIAEVVIEHRRQENLKLAELIANRVATAAPRHGVDGGSNSVFADKTTTHDGYDKNGQLVQIATAPGALPRVPNPPGTTIPRAQAPSAVPEEVESPAETQVASSSAPSSTVLSSKTAAQPTRTASAGDTGPVALRGTTDTATRPRHTPEAAPSARPQQAPKAVAAAASAEKAKTVEAQAEPSRELRTAFSAAATNNSIAGAQPVVPTGSFASRWSGLR